MQDGPRDKKEEAKVIIVSGCPRSGTSMMMRIMHHIYGEDRILGYKDIPTRKKNQAVLTEIQQYITDKRRAGLKEKPAKLKRAKDMNPNGYFEMEFTVRGVRYMPRHEKLLNEILEDEQPRICKIVSQGLMRSDPRYITKIVYMVRDPRAVAKSQERLGRQSPMDPESAPESDGKKALIRTAKMFNGVTVGAARWILEHTDTPTHLVNYDELLDNPLPELEKLGEFLGEDFSGAASMIDPSLRRSVPEEIDDDSGANAMVLYTLLKSGDWQGIIDYAKAKAKEPRKITDWYCTRLKSAINVEVCKLCKSHRMTTANLINNAERKKIKWRVEPCVYECGIDGSVGVSVAESVENSHWVALMP